MKVQVVNLHVSIKFVLPKKEKAYFLYKRTLKMDKIQDFQVYMYLYMNEQIR